MRFKIPIIIGLIVATCFACGQDINRSAEWKIKRAEQSQAQLESEMKSNGSYAPKGIAPAVTDARGNAVTKRAKTHTKISDEGGDSETDASVGKMSESETKDQFSIAGAAIQEEVKEEPRPVPVLAICASIGALVVLGFFFLTRRIQVPDSALNR